MLAEIAERCDTIEECYEFMLAYAAQGLPSDKGSRSGGQIREYLGRAVKAISGLADSCATALKQGRLDPAEKYRAFFAVLERDASDSLAAIELVLAQPANRLSVDRQPERFHSLACASHRSVSSDRDRKDSTHAGEAHSVERLEFHFSRRMF
jgi:hypothetical protein